MTTIENPNIKLVEYVNRNDDGETTELIGYQCKVCSMIEIAFHDSDTTLIVRSMRLHEFSIRHLHRS